MPDAPPPASAPLLDDQPSTVDLLHFGEFAAALREVILNPHTRTPFIIGVLGRWGTGKTTLLRMLEAELRQRGATTAWFTAWLYNQEEEIWAAFLQSLVTRIAAELPLHDKIRFSAALFRRGLRSERLMYDGARLVVRAATVAAPLIAGALLATAVASQMTAALLQSGGAVGSALLAAWYLLRPAVSAVRKRGAVDFSLYRSVDFEEHIGFLDRFREQFGRMVAALPGSRRRVVIFVDDLDRCGPDKALQLLDAIKVFLDVPDCIFVLGMDIAVIQQALAAKYPDDVVAQKEYLSKIVQLPFQLPPLTEADLQGYVRGLDVTFPDPRCRDVFLAALSRNPREIKRVINTFSLHWYLAQARAVAQAVTPVRLAKVVVIQQAHPPLFAVLRDSPELLAVLETELRRQVGGPEPPPPPRTDAGEYTRIFPATPPGTSPGAAGAVLPASLSPFAHDVSLTRLLTMHPMAPAASDDSSFAHLSADEIAVYFTLARRSVHPAPGAPAMTAEDLPRLGDRYNILRRIGAGATSSVFLAEDRNTGRKVAIKTLQPTLATDPEWLARFDREIRVLAQLPAHPHVVAVLDSGTSADVDGQRVPFYVMEYLEAETLGDLLARTGLLEPYPALRLLAPLFDALAHVHAAGVLHRDIKPSTILVTGESSAKLADFSLAFESASGRDELTRVGFVIGTPEYMSPEQLLDQPLDPRSDLFSFGLVIYRTLAGRSPDAGGSVQDLMRRRLTEAAAPPSSLVATLPPAFDAFCARILARNPNERFASAVEAKAAFVSSLQAPAPVAAEARH